MKSRFLLGQKDDQPSDVRMLIHSGYRYALSLTHHRHDAEDLIQQACLRVLNAKGRLENRNYLFVTIRNLYIDSSRRRSSLSLSEMDEDPATNPKHHHVTCLERTSEVDRLLSCLKPEQRECLYLNCVEGYTAEEIAKLTDQPRNTVLSHLSRAKKRLEQTHRVSQRAETP